MAKTVAIMLVMLGLSIAPLTAFAQIPETDVNIPNFAYQWLVYVIVASGSITVLLMATNSLQKPTSFASLPVYLFFSLTLFVIFDILAISFIPTDFFGNSFPISTVPFTDAENLTQWTLNIGGFAEDEDSTNLSGGLQIPIYVIIAGILGAYIRYLYIGISEFKESFQQKLNNFEESYHRFFRALDACNAHTGRTITPWPPAPILDIIAFGNIWNLHHIVNEWRVHARKFEAEVILLDEPAPPGRDPNCAITHSEDISVLPGSQRIVTYQEKRKFQWSKIRDAESDFKKHRFIVGLEISTHILKTVGSFFLGPLLAVLAWLLLSISGTDDVLTFALVSFAIGLTTKAIITRVMNFVGEKIADESPTTTPAAATTTTPAAATTTTPAAATTTTPAAATTTTPAAATMTTARPAATVPAGTETTITSIIQLPFIIIVPKPARMGQTVSIQGIGFRANSQITLEFKREGPADGLPRIFEVQLPSTDAGTFLYQSKLSQYLRPGTYNLFVRDEDNKSVNEEFAVL